MSEIKPNEINETPQLNLENHIMPENGMTLQEAKSLWEKEFQDLKNNNTEIGDEKDVTDYEWGGKYTTFEERVNQTPKDGERGKFEGERGNSKFVPSDGTEDGTKCIDILKKHGIDGIKYKNGEPDFSEVSEATLKIDNMTEHRPDYFDKNGIKQDGNYTQGDKILAEQWNKEAKDGKTDWNEKDVAGYRDTNKLTWHERCDTKTMDLVPSVINKFFSHSGGVSECRIRDNSEGGKFDE